MTSHTSDLPQQPQPEFAEIAHEAQGDTSAPSTQQASKSNPVPLHHEQSITSKFNEQADEKMQSTKNEEAAVPAEKYNKLKRKFAELRKVSTSNLTSLGIPADAVWLGKQHTTTRELNS